jgi:hypothetical protein
LLAMLGLFGVMMAGVAADALFSIHNDARDEGEDLPDDDGDSLADGNLLDDITGDPTIPISDDTPDPQDSPATCPAPMPMTTSLLTMGPTWSMAVVAMT